MSRTVIKVENLNKAYQLGQIGTGTVSRDLERWFARVRGKEDPFLKIGERNNPTTKGKNDIVWSLKNINFEIGQGDAVGIIGKNGAGKSTLLKILSKVTAPTSGKITGEGRIASLLEVGTGFHPELSGRENIFLNGAILGMRKKEIQRKLDEIVDFAGVERYLDTPVKRYSSGMYVRLAFAVAAHLESEILIVDEVLAVGDAEFQKKCLGKMGEVSRGEGRTVLFVSHNMTSILNICNTGLLLNHGEIGQAGSINEVVDKYLLINSQHQNTYLFNQIQHSSLYPIQLTVEDLEGNLLNEIPLGSPWQIRVRFNLNIQIHNLIVGLGMTSNMSVNIRTSWSPSMFFEAGIHEVIFKETDILFSSGQYLLSLGFSYLGETLFYGEHIATITISEISASKLDKSILKTFGTGMLLNPMKVERTS